MATRRSWGASASALQLQTMARGACLLRWSTTPSAPGAWRASERTTSRPARRRARRRAVRPAVHFQGRRRRGGGRPRGGEGDRHAPLVADGAAAEAGVPAAQAGEGATSDKLQAAGGQAQRQVGVGSGGARVAAARERSGGRPDVIVATARRNRAPPPLPPPPRACVAGPPHHLHASRRPGRRGCGAGVFQSRTAAATAVCAGRAGAGAGCCSHGRARCRPCRHAALRGSGRGCGGSRGARGGRRGPCRRGRRGRGGGGRGGDGCGRCTRGVAGRATVCCHWRRSAAPRARGQHRSV